MLEVKPNLIALLKERGMTQQQLSELSGVPQSAISRFDTNKQHSDIHLFSIARALNVKIEDIFVVSELD
ncbi:helix-turn-helix protein [compost metagenome]